MSAHETNTPEPAVGSGARPDGSGLGEAGVQPAPGAAQSPGAQAGDGVQTPDPADVAAAYAAAAGAKATAADATVADAPPAATAEDSAGAEQHRAAAEAAPAAQEAPASADVEALAARAQKADEYLALAQRTKADFENYRKRAARDAASAQERGAVKLAQELLPAIDNLERAMAHFGEAPDAANGDGADSLMTGIKHVHSDVVAALGRAGIERYSPEGERFDPQYHEAVAQQPVEGTEPGVVVEVFQRGYRMGENVVRPARVVVAG